MDIVSTIKDGQSKMLVEKNNEHSGSGDGLGLYIANRNKDTGTVHSDTINKPLQGLAPTPHPQN